MKLGPYAKKSKHKLMRNAPGCPKEGKGGYAPKKRVATARRLKCGRLQRRALPIDTKRRPTFERAPTAKATSADSLTKSHHTMENFRRAPCHVTPRDWFVASIVWRLSARSLWGEFTFGPKSPSTRTRRQRWLRARRISAWPSAAQRRKTTASNVSCSRWARPVGLCANGALYPLSDDAAAAAKWSPSAEEITNV
ncbi:unnamed protein product [Ixodes persulcatus]